MAIHTIQGEQSRAAEAERRRWMQVVKTILNDPGIDTTSSNKTTSHINPHNTNIGSYLEVQSSIIVRHDGSGET